jgi:hypothetical protein
MWGGMETTAIEKDPLPSFIDNEVTGCGLFLVPDSCRVERGSSDSPRFLYMIGACYPLFLTGNRSLVSTNHESNPNPKTISIFATEVFTTRCLQTSAKR